MAAVAAECTAVAPASAVRARTAVAAVAAIAVETAVAAIAAGRRKREARRRLLDVDPDSDGDVAQVVIESTRPLIDVDGHDLARLVILVVRATTHRCLHRQAEGILVLGRRAVGIVATHRLGTARTIHDGDGAARRTVGVTAVAAVASRRHRRTRCACETRYAAASRRSSRATRARRAGSARRAAVTTVAAADV